MCDEVRVGLMEDIEKPGGIVGAAETFVGGLGTSRHWHEHGGDGTGGVSSEKLHSPARLATRATIVIFGLFLTERRLGVSPSHEPDRTVPSAAAALVSEGGVVAVEFFTA
jgi:hypothetical protein